MQITSGSMVQDYYARLSRKLHAERKAKIAALKTREDAEQYVAEVRNKIKQAFGPFPERTPLKAHITGTEMRDGIRVDKVIFESRPGIPVTGLFFFDPAIAGKRPGVLSVCGHSGNGKGSDVYQTYCFNLAAKGFAAFMIDPVSQGERFQFLDRKDATHFAGSNVKEHNMMGKGLLLCDEFFGAFRVWDAMRGVDYLVSRREVDASQLAVTGNSGGGTLSSYVFALEDRITLGAPSCFLTTFDRNLRNELPADAEQTPPGMYGSGCEMADFIIARAPLPALMLGQKYDFFDPRGTVEGYEEAKRVYELLGAADKIACFVGPCGHGYSKENREQMYDFFSQQRFGRRDDGEKTFKTLTDQEVWCTPDGRVKGLPETKTLVEWIGERALELEKNRPALDRDALRAKLRAEFDFARTGSPDDFDILRSSYTVDSEGSRQHVRIIDIYPYESEDNVKGYLHVLRGEGEPGARFPEGRECTLCVSHLDAESELMNDGTAGIEEHGKLFMLDVRGTGKSTPTTCDRNTTYFASYTFDYFYASQGLLTNRGYLAGKVRDVAAAVRLLKHMGFDKIHLAGRGLGSLVATFAAATLDDADYASLSCANGPIAFRPMLENGVWMWPQSHIYKGMLKDFDLPEFYNALGASRVTLVNPWNQRMRPLAGAELAAAADAVKLDRALLREVRV